MSRWFLICALTAVLAGCGLRNPPELKLAVDAGFQPAIEALRSDFEAACRCRLHITSGSSGVLYSQIRAGQHFDLFLSADSARPVLLENAGLTVPASRQTYARGQLALWINKALNVEPARGNHFHGAESASADRELTLRQMILLLGPGKHKLVVSDPQLAPDGDAAVRMLKKLRLWPRLKSRMAYAGHAGHAQIMLQQGEGDMGVIPYSQALASGNSGQYMRIPAYLHPPIHQQLVIMRGTRERTRAIQLLQYLRSAQVQERLIRLGFLRAELPHGTSPDGTLPDVTDPDRAIPGAASPDAT